MNEDIRSASNAMIHRCFRMQNAVHSVHYMDTFLTNIWIMDFNNQGSEGTKWKLRTPALKLYKIYCNIGLLKDSYRKSSLKDSSNFLWFDLLIATLITDTLNSLTFMHQKCQFSNTYAICILNLINQSRPISNRYITTAGLQHA